MSGYSHSRRILVLGGVSAAAFIAGLRPRFGWAKPPELEALIEDLSAGRAQHGRLSLNIPRIAENGAIVPVTLTVESPMTETDYCRSIHLFAERNPFPKVVSATFSPLSGKAELQLRIRLAETQRVAALAVMADGSTWLTEETVEVTIGGCVN